MVARFCITLPMLFDAEPRMASTKATMCDMLANEDAAHGLWRFSTV